MDEDKTNFRVKTISFLGRRVPILCQNEFGPCALLGIVNALLLRNSVSLSADHGAVSLETAVNLVATRLLEANATTEVVRENMQDALAMLPTLERGLDVNVRFGGGFEFTPGLSVFDLLDLAIVHGWLVDPEDPARDSVASSSYNQVVEKVVGENDPLAADFLQRTASQLTYYGLSNLHSQQLRDNQLAVFYRNHHFSTVFKYRHSIYLLVTDLGYQAEPHVVWEKLDMVDGDTEFVDASFTASNHPPSQHHQQHPDDVDYLVALQLQQEVEEQPHSSFSSSAPIIRPSPATSTSFPQQRQPSAQEDADFQAALRLQYEMNQVDAAEERRQAQPPPDPRRQQSPPTTSNNRTAGGCSVS